MLGVYDTDKNGSISHLVAWLSLCILAAAWGSSLDPDWRPLWRDVGAYGLTSALGLSAAARYRGMRRRHALRRRLENRLQCGLRTLLDDLTPTAKKRSTGTTQLLSGLPGDSQADNQPRLSVEVRWPVVITPLTTSGRADYPWTVGFIRNVSRTAIGLNHDQAIPSGLARITFRRANGQPISMIMDVRWCRRADDRTCHSGLHFRSLGSPSDLEADLPLLRNAEQNSLPAETEKALACAV